MNGLIGILTAIFALPSFFNAGISEPVASVKYIWKNIEFMFPNEQERTNAIQSGVYIPQNVVLNDVDVWPGN